MQYGNFEEFRSKFMISFPNVHLEETREISGEMHWTKICEDNQIRFPDKSWWNLLWNIQINIWRNLMKYPIEFIVELQIESLKGFCGIFGIFLYWLTQWLSVEAQMNFSSSSLLWFSKEYTVKSPTKFMIQFQYHDYLKM